MDTMSSCHVGVGKTLSGEGEGATSNRHEESVSSSSPTTLHLEQLFKACDTKGRGVIGQEEFREVCNTYGISMEDSDVIFSDLDHDGDGYIDYGDFSFGFCDYLTPGARRGSFQVNLLDPHFANKQLQEMEKRHATAKTAWKHFTHNVGPTNCQPFLRTCGLQVYDIMEDLRSISTGKDHVNEKLEKALTDLIRDVHGLHEEYRNLEVSFRKERELHAAQLAALGEELDQQLAKAEAKARAEARQEAHRQMEMERKRISTEMEGQLATLSAQIRGFQKVEEWLSEEESRHVRKRSTEEQTKLCAAESENRSLRSALVEAQMKATVLQTQLTQKRTEYMDVCQELHTEKTVATEYRNQCDLMQNHLSILSEANRVLSDANDCFSTVVQVTDDAGRNHRALEEGRLDQSSLSRPMSDSKLTVYPFPDNDKDSGRGTLLEEIRASEGDGSPLPSGLWCSSPAPSSCHRLTRPGSPSRSPSAERNDDHLEVSCIREEPRTLSPEMMEVDIDDSGDYAEEVFEEQDNNNVVGDMQVNPQRTFKIILAGDAAVGKTTFIQRICHGNFLPNMSSTIGVDFRVKTVAVDGNCVALQLWDTAGQERFRSLTKSYFRRADGVILMYDVTNERTFVNIRHWIQNVEEGAGRKVPIVLCGNKVDLRAQYYEGTTCVSHQEGTKLSRQCGAMFMETSPKTGLNVMEALMLLAREMSLVEDADVKNSLQLQQLEQKGKKKSCCGS